MFFFVDAHKIYSSYEWFTTILEKLYVSFLQLRKHALNMIVRNRNIGLK